MFELKCKRIVEKIPAPKHSTSEVTTSRASLLRNVRDTIGKQTCRGGEQGREGAEGKGEGRGELLFVYLLTCLSGSVGKGRSER